MEELQTVVSRRNKQIKELKVKLGKRERELDRLEKDFVDEKRQCEKYERRILYSGKLSHGANFRGFRGWAYYRKNKNRECFNHQ